MSRLGVHFAIPAEQAERLLAAEDDDELLAIVEEIEEQWEVTFASDKGWDALHRCLSNGTLNVEEGEPPLNRVFLGGRVLNREEAYFVVLLEPAEVVDVAAALAKVSHEWLRSRYFETPFPDYQGDKSEDDWDYARSSFVGLPEFFRSAAGKGRYVVFTVDP
jgi:hypothetical protein